jgi:hypothetical protein
MKYTVIYNERWQSGSHWHCLTKMKRIEIEFNDSNLFQKISNEVGSEDICFIFEGWPKMQGE